RRWMRPGIGLAQNLATHALRALNFGELAYPIHVAAHGGIVAAPHGELDRPDNCRRRHETEGIVRHHGDIDHEGDAAAGPDLDGGATRGYAHQRILDRTRQPYRVLGDA